MPGLSLFPAGHSGRGALSSVPSAFVKAFGAQACLSPENRVCARKAGFQADRPGGGGSFPSADLQLCHLGQGCSSFCCQDEWGATASWGPRVLWASALPPLAVFTSGYGESKWGRWLQKQLPVGSTQEGGSAFVLQIRTSPSEPLAVLSSDLVPRVSKPTK